jgi:hypothetical protein
MVTMGDAVLAGELLRLALKLGPEVFQAVHAAVRATRPELVPAELPERADDAIRAATDDLIAAKFRRKSEPPLGEPPPSSGGG